MWLLSFIILASALDCQKKQIFMIMNSTYPFKLMDLPYDYSFLSEVFPVNAMILHHDQIQNVYLQYLNDYISSNLTLYSNVQLSELVSDGLIDTNLGHWAAATYNHYLYWWSLTSSSCSVPVPGGDLLTKINNVWGSFSSFESNFKYVAFNAYGDGWIWLCYNTTGMLEIITTDFETNTLMQTSGNKCYPVIGIDLWEHSYYIKYTYDKLSFINDVWELIDWSMAEYFYETFSRYYQAIPF